eukprot:13345091-Ditylum_brightwellii.AAC.1
MLVEEEDLISILKEDIKVFLVSDGGEMDGLGYFGWVIGTHIEELVRHKGHAAGNPKYIELLRSENFAFITILRCTQTSGHTTVTTAQQSGGSSGAKPEPY